MIIKSLILKNFRQLPNAKIDFAHGNMQKNVTIVIGNNGTGKTTLEQAVTWCMYGKIKFTDILLNKKVWQKLSIGEMGDVASASVSLILEHAGYTYTITRCITYQKNKDVPVKTTLEMAYVGSGTKGIQENVEEYKCKTEINKILPEGLSSFFFFDGEKINTMSEQISDKTKVYDFENAVKSMLGMGGIKQAMDHIDGRGKLTVVKKFRNDMDENSDSEISVLNKKIEDNKTEIQKIDDAKNNLTDLITKSKREKEQAEKDIRQYAEGAKLQEQQEQLEEQQNQARSVKAQLQNDIAKLFQGNVLSIASFSLISKALAKLSELDLNNIDARDITSETIDWLLKRHKCLCGCDLLEGSDAYTAVKEWRKYVPPENMSSVARSFKGEAYNRLLSFDEQSVKNLIESKLIAISKQEDVVQECEDKINDFAAAVTGNNKEKIQELHAHIKKCDEQQNLAIETLQENAEKKGSLNNDIQISEKELQRLNQQNAKNKKLQKNIEFAQKLYRFLENIYKNEEKKVKERLEYTINEIFQKIFNNELYLTISDGYRVTIKSSKDNTNVEASAGQNNAAVFAFIASLIKLAKDNGDSENKDLRLLSSEIYPLVMDAPLSTFDNDRIDAICAILPEIAEQVIIFIKDTEGDIAKKRLGNRIGAFYNLESLDVNETVVKKETV